MNTESTSKKPKKGSIRQEDISTLLRRYPAAAVLSLLQEVATFPESKIDWNALVKNTTTGISNAREYQMLWRHLAYCNELLDKPKDGAEPLDDDIDSDLEFELEAYPTVNSDASADIAACVKVLITYGLPSSSIIGHNLTVEAPLVINVPNGQSSRAASENKQASSSNFGTNITAPISVHKHQSVIASAEGLDGNSNIPPRKRRKAWSKAEDLELEAAVEKFGEANWINILKGNFKGDRTASQLSKRWATIKNRKNLTVESTKSSGSQLSDMEAAHHAISVALNMPQSRKSGIGSKPPQNLSHPATVSAKLSPTKPMSTPKTTSSIKRSPPNPSLDPDMGIKAAAVAVGARIGTQKDAASLLIAAQAKKAVHIIPSGGGSRIKCFIPGPSSLRPGTFHISTGSSSQVASTSSSMVKNAPSAKSAAATSNARATKQTTTDLPLEQETNDKVVGARAASETSNASQSRQDGASASAKLTREPVQKESEMRDGTKNTSAKINVEEGKDGDATNSGKKNLF